jgi:glycosyltransferase involved in cell wall biosynthesis
MPSLTIGLVVYNNAATIGRAMDSLLGQRFRDFVLIVSDDCSHDESVSIANRYALRDRRVQVHSHSSNRNYGNFRWVVSQARTPYFMFAAADDVWDPDFVGSCVSVLENESRAVLAVPRVRFDSPDAQGPGAGTYPLTGTPRQNLARFLREPLDNSRMYGVFRTEVAQRAFPRTDHHAFDWTFSAATLKDGTHLEVPRILMFRDTTASSKYVSYVGRDNRGRLARLFPLLPMTRSLLIEKRIPLSIAILRSLVRINLDHHVTYLEYRHGPVGRRLARLVAILSNRL